MGVTVTFDQSNYVSIQFVSAVKAGFLRMARFALGSVQIWFERMRQRQVLSQLDERLLRDVGLTQEKVRTELHKPFWKP